MINYTCKQIWRLLIPDGAVGANKNYFDLFNATSATSNTGNRIVISSVRVMVAGDVAVTGVVAANLHLHKTSAVGTGGTTATLQGTSNTAATISSMTPPPGNLPSGITARLAPSGGATIGAWLSQVSVFTEETNAGTYLDKWLHRKEDEPIVITQGQGIKVIQGTVASAGSIGFVVDFGILDQ
jgi:hypothetical protein